MTTEHRQDYFFLIPETTEVIKITRDFNELKGFTSMKEVEEFLNKPDQSREHYDHNYESIIVSEQQLLLLINTAIEKGYFNSIEFTIKM